MPETDPTQSSITIKLKRFFTTLFRTKYKIVKVEGIDEEHLSALSDPGIDATKLDRRSTILLQAARSQTESIDERYLSGLDDPGMDVLRGSFGSFGSMIRARSVRRMSQGSSQYGTGGGLPPGAAAPSADTSGLPNRYDGSPFEGLKRHQLYDAPVPYRDIDEESLSASSIHSQSQQRQHKRPTIKFGSQDVAHFYNRPPIGNPRAIHEHRAAVGSPDPMPTLQQQQQQQHPIVYPPIPHHKFPLDTPTATSRDDDDDSDNARQTRISGVSGTLPSFPSVTDSGRSEEIWDDEAWERLKDRAREKNRGHSVVTDTTSGSKSNLKEKGKEKSNKANSSHRTRKYPKGEGDRGENVSF